MDNNPSEEMVLISLNILQYMAQQIINLEKQVECLQRDRAAILQVIEREIVIQENAC